jgi:hypothetical protein
MAWNYEISTQVSMFICPPAGQQQFNRLNKPTSSAHNVMMMMIIVEALAVISHIKPDCFKHSADEGRRKDEGGAQEILISLLISSCAMKIYMLSESDTTLRASSSAPRLPSSLDLITQTTCERIITCRKLLVAVHDKQCALWKKSITASLPACSSFAYGKCHHLIIRYGLLLHLLIHPQPTSPCCDFAQSKAASPEVKSRSFSIYVCALVSRTEVGRERDSQCLNHKAT